MGIEIWIVQSKICTSIVTPHKALLIIHLKGVNYGLELNWFQLGPIPQNTIEGHYDITLVVFSYLIAVFASFVALDFIGRLHIENQPRIKRYWLFGGAFAMGVGIWSMHFVGMLAFVMPMPMSYNAAWTLSSLIIAIIASGFAFYLLYRTDRSFWRLAIGGVLLGLGICSIHYMGMEAMKVDINIHYTPGLFLLSITLAVIASEAALWLSIKSNEGAYRRQLYLKAISSLIMGAAITGMHYTGMFAAVFTPLATHTEHASQLNQLTLAYSVAFTVGLILLIALIISTYKYIIVNITENEKNFLDALLNNMTGGVIACDTKGNITVFNDVLRKMVGIDEKTDSIPDWKPHYFSTPDNTNNKTIQPLSSALNGQYIKDLEVIINPNSPNSIHHVTVNGQPIINKSGHKLGAVITVHDVTHRVNLEKNLLYLATHDTLTNLPNQLSFQKILTKNLARAKRRKTHLGILFIDIDNFKKINDKFGHHLGDKLIIQTSERLITTLRDTDNLYKNKSKNEFLARVGGDEFIAILKDVDSRADLTHYASQLLSAFHTPFIIEEKEICVHLSIGIASYPKDGNTPDELVHHADMAMYQAKKLGKNNFQFFDPDKISD